MTFSFDELSPLGYIIAIIIVFLMVKMYRESKNFNLRCVISDIDGRKYCVRERHKLGMAADLLAKANRGMKELVAHVGEQYSTRENVKRLVERFNPDAISETLPTSEYTAYSENKGERIAFCLDETKTNDTGINKNTKKPEEYRSRLIDLNTLMFVAIHELAHVASESVGHTDEFWSNFKFLLHEAEGLNIYKPIDYKNEPQEYCGMTITDNPYFDM